MAQSSVFLQNSDPETSHLFSCIEAQFNTAMYNLQKLIDVAI